jgi:hypothetical protein
MTIRRDQEGVMTKTPTNVHGVVDYVVGAALTTLPRAFGMSGRPAQLLEGAGAGAIAYSLMTNYELGIVKALPMKAHLALDALSGGALIGAAAMLDDESDEDRLILAGVGLFEIAAALTTQTTSSTEGVPSTRAARETRSTAGEQKQLADADVGAAD